MDETKKAAILRSVAEALTSYDGDDTLDVDTVEIVDGELLVDNYDGVQFAVKIEAV